MTFTVDPRIIFPHKLSFSIVVTPLSKSLGPLKREVGDLVKIIADVLEVDVSQIMVVNQEHPLVIKLPKQHKRTLESQGVVAGASFTLKWAGTTLSKIL